MDVREKVVEEVRNTDAYKRCEELRREINYLVFEFSHYDKEAIKLLNYFKPFSYKRKIIPLEKDHYLVIGHQIYVLSGIFFPVNGVERTERHDPAIWQSVMNAASPRPLKVKIEGIHEMHSTHKNKSSVQFAQLPITSTTKSIHKYFLNQP